MGSYVRIWQLVLLAILFIVKPSIQLTHYSSENQTLVVESVQPCHIYGDPDLYGIGIRTSFYIQYGVCGLAQILKLQESISAAVQGTVVIMLAVLINTYISTAKGSFAALEWFIVSILVLFLPLWVAIPYFDSFIGKNAKVVTKRIIDSPRYIRESAAWLWRAQNQQRVAGYQTTLGQPPNPNDYKFEFPSDYDENPVGTGFILLLSSVFSLSQPWLYFKILDQGRKAGCDPKVWVFAPIHIYSPSWVRFLRFFAIINAITGILYLPWAIVFMLRGLVQLWRGVDGEADAGENQQPTDSREHKDTLQESATVPTRWLHFKINITAKLIVGYLFLYPCFIAFVEKTILINQLDLSSAPLNSASQLIPFLVAVFSTPIVAWSILREGRKEKEKAENRAADQLYKQMQEVLANVSRPIALQPQGSGNPRQGIQVGHDNSG